MVLNLFYLCDECCGAVLDFCIDCLCWLFLPEYAMFMGGGDWFVFLKLGDHGPVRFRDEGSDFLFSFDEDGKGWRLHPSDGKEISSEST